MKSYQKMIIPVALLSLTGCGVHPQKVTEQEITKRVDMDTAEMFKGQEGVHKAISLHEATARALQYNLDYKLKLMEETLYQKNLQLSNFEMMPKLLASAGYRDRSNYYGSSSYNLIEGVENYSYSTSQERANRTAGVSFSWNILDFGISYYKAKQQANQFLIAEERRRKVVQNIMQDVRSAYYRALAAQKLTKRCDDLMIHVSKALEGSVLIEQKGLVSPSQALSYQRMLLETTNVLVQKRRELELAKLELAALMNIPAGTDFTIVDEKLAEPVAVPTDLRNMERVALMQRPELREEDYKERISIDDAKRLILGALPNLGVDASLQYDSNKYLYKNTWAEYGARGSWDLTRLMALPATLAMNDSQGDVDKVRRAALTMAIVTQVQLATQRYDMALFDYAIADRTDSVESKLLKHTQAGARVGTENDLEVIRAKTKALLTEMQKYAAYASVQTAYARLINSLGLDLVPPAGKMKTIDDLAQYMQKNTGAWDSIMRDFATKYDPVVRSSTVKTIEAETPKGTK